MSGERRLAKLDELANKGERREKKGERRLAKLDELANKGERQHHLGARDEPPIPSYALLCPPMLSYIILYYPILLNYIEL